MEHLWNIDPSLGIISGVIASARVVLGETETLEQAAARLKMSVEELKKLFGSCFVAGTPILTVAGSKLVEEIRPGDLVLSRSEHDPEGPIEAKAVEATFVRVAAVLELRVGGRGIRTTAEHPFWVRGQGWLPASELAAGDQLRSHDGRWLTVEAVSGIIGVTTVYNFRVADYHTYFVGFEEWGFSVWAHNAVCAEQVVEALQAQGITLAKDDPKVVAIVEAMNNPARDNAVIKKALKDAGLSNSRAQEARHLLQEMEAARPLPKRPGSSPIPVADLTNAGGNPRTTGEVNEVLDQLFQQKGAKYQDLQPHDFHNGHGLLPDAEYVQFDVPAPHGDRGVRRIYYDPKNDRWYFSANSHDPLPPALREGLTGDALREAVKDGAGAHFVDITDAVRARYRLRGELPVYTKIK